MHLLILADQVIQIAQVAKRLRGLGQGSRSVNLSFDVVAGEIAWLSRESSTFLRATRKYAVDAVKMRLR